MEIMGDYGSLANQDLLLSNKHQGHPTEVAALFGKRFVAISEPEQGRSLNESRVKELTGDKTVTARRMREDFWEFPPSHTFWMSTNHKPEISGGDEGIWRRIKLIPFTVDLRKVTDVDPRIHEKLETELSGILNWMLAGWKLYQAKGLSSFEPNEVKAATQEYRDNEDEVGCFLREAYVENPAFVIGATDAFKAYQDFGGKMTQTKFGTAMAKRFKKRRHTTGRYKNKIVYEGIGDSEM
jgi:putative DNA primase/helicase